MTKTEAPRCTRCHRPLTSATSIRRGYGEHCGRLNRRERAATVLTRTFKGAEAARTKALNLLADKALIPTRHAGQYLAASSDGTQTYLVDTIERSCTCRGFAHQKRCYHLVAADTLELAGARRNGLTLAA